MRNLEIKFISSDSNLSYNIFKFVKSNIIKVVCKSSTNIVYEKYFNINEDLTFTEDSKLSKIHCLKAVDAQVDSNDVNKFIQQIIEKTYNNETN